MKTVTQRISITTLIAIALLTTSLTGLGQKPAPKSAASALKIVTDNLVKFSHGDCTGCYYEVKGSIYNSSGDGISNVTIKYVVWKKYIGRDDRGLIIKASGGLVVAHIKYVPPKQTINFTASGGDVPVQTDGLPDPLQAEITADWDKNEI